MTEEPTAIDYSVCIRRGDPIVTQERQAKGGLMLHNGIWQEDFKDIIDWMEKTRIIEPHHSWAAYDLQRLKTAANSLTGTDVNRFGYQSSGESEICPVWALKHICAALQKNDRHWYYVNRFCFGEVEKDGELIHNGRKGS